jgi:hypothetical protein
MLNQAQAGAFERWFSSICEQKRVKILIAKVAWRWMNKAASIVFQCWSEYTEHQVSNRLPISHDNEDETHLKREEALQEERDRFYQEIMELQRRLEEENLRAKTHLTEEIETVQHRLQQQSRKVIQRLLNQHLHAAFNTFVERVADARHMRETCRKMVLRMTNRQLSQGFCRFAESVESRREQRTILTKIMAQWAKRYMVQAWELWQEIMAKKTEQDHQDAVKKLHMVMAKEGHYEQKYNHLKQRFRKHAEWLVDKMTGMNVARAFDLFHDKVTRRRKIEETFSITSWRLSTAQYFGAGSTQLPCTIICLYPRRQKQHWRESVFC